jgi:hypothetical protein
MEHLNWFAISVALGMLVSVAGLVYAERRHRRRVQVEGERRAARHRKHKEILAAEGAHHEAVHTMKGRR